VFLFKFGLAILTHCQAGIEKAKDDEQVMTVIHRLFASLEQTPLPNSSVDSFAKIEPNRDIFEELLQYTASKELSPITFESIEIQRAKQRFKVVKKMDENNQMSLRRSA